MHAYFSAIRLAMNSATLGNEVSRPLISNATGGNLARGEGLGGPGGFGGIPIHQREIRVVLVLLMLLGAASVFLCGQSLDIALSVRTGRANTSPDHPKP